MPGYPAVATAAGAAAAATGPGEELIVNVRAEKAAPVALNQWCLAERPPAPVRIATCLAPPSVLGVEHDPPVHGVDGAGKGTPGLPRVSFLGMPDDPRRGQIGRR
ncbi:MAG: hypothetical protein ABSE77_14155 [Acidimicrobiales bacterium]